MNDSDPAASGTPAPPQVTQPQVTQPQAAQQPVPDEALSFKTLRDEPTSTPTLAKTVEVTEAKHEVVVPRNEVPEAGSPKAKRKSSWESLASMFGVKVERPQPVEDVAPTQDVAQPAAGRRQAEEVVEEQKLSLFSGENSSDSNPALKEMFGDAPKGSREGWGRPRVVDDLGWEDDAEPAVSHKAAEAAEPQAKEDDEEAPRRGRRRRRGRKGRGEPVEGKASPVEPSLEWGGADEFEAGFEEDEVWQEPDSFAIAESDEFDVSDCEDASLDTEVGEVERRSSRRRRRGRGRGRERELSDAGSAERLDRQPPAREADELEDIVEDEPNSLSARPQSPARTGGESDERGSRSRRRRRGGGEGRASEGPRERVPAERPRREAVARTADSDDAELEPEYSFDDDGEAGERGAGKHRSIPTWYESIESLVQANIENRKKGDNRGAPRGRSRGRR